MKKIIFKTQLSALFLLFAINSNAQVIPKIVDVPDSFTSQQKKTFEKESEKIKEQKKNLNTRISDFNLKCEKVEKKTSLERECADEQVLIKEGKGKLIEAINQFNKDILNALDAIRIIVAMNALAKDLGWSVDEQLRLDSALNKLDFDGDTSVTSTTIVQTWQDILTRGHGEDFKKEAAQGKGSGLPGAGKQSFEDCTLFALANATGLPYPEVAARATKLIREGKWRNAAESSNPQRTIEKQGLTGGEVVMLAEAFGRVEVIPSSDFARILKEGHTVMTNVVPYNGNLDAGHQVVLTKTFQHKGETWFELIDSNQEGSQQRLYLSNTELYTILRENGVVYRPDRGTIPKIPD